MSRAEKRVFFVSWKCYKFASVLLRGKPSSKNTKLRSLVECTRQKTRSFEPWLCQSVYRLTKKCK